MTTEDKINELVIWSIDSLADVFGGKADTLTSLQYNALDRIFRYDGIVPYNSPKKSNAEIELEYNEMLETKNNVL
jgi:hypothetical protein